MQQVVWHAPRPPDPEIALWPYCLFVSIQLFKFKDTLKRQVWTVEQKACAKDSLEAHQQTFWRFNKFFCGNTIETSPKSRRMKMSLLRNEYLIFIQQLKQWNQRNAKVDFMAVLFKREPAEIVRAWSKLLECALESDLSRFPKQKFLFFHVYLSFRISVLVF